MTLLAIAFFVLLVEQGVRNRPYMKTFVAYHIERLSSDR